MARAPRPRAALVASPQTGPAKLSPVPCTRSPEEGSCIPAPGPCLHSFSIRAYVAASGVASSPPTPPRALRMLLAPRDASGGRLPMAVPLRGDGTDRGRGMKAELPTTHCHLPGPHTWLWHILVSQRCLPHSP